MRTLLLLLLCLLPFNPGESQPGLAHPAVEFYVRSGGVGLLLGFLSWGLHKTLLSRIEKFLPGFDVSGDTTTITKKSDVEKP